MNRTEQLRQRYFLGLTTLEEERELKALEDGMPDDVAAVFSYAAMAGRPLRRGRHVMARVAASLLVAATAATLLFTMPARISDDSALATMDAQLDIVGEAAADFDAETSGQLDIIASEIY